MFNKKVSKFLVLSLFVIASIKPTVADAKIYVGADIGTTGLNFHASYYFKNLIGIRAEGNFIPKSVSGKLDTLVKKADSRIYDSKSTFNSYGIDLSVRPLFGSWHIDVGMRQMNYKITASTKQQVYGYDAMVYDDFTFKIATGIKPYIGTGWTFNPILGLNINFDIGVIWTGKWKASSSGLRADIGDNVNNQFFAEALEDTEMEVQSVVGKVNRDIPSFLQFWPVVKLGIGWQFNI